MNKFFARRPRGEAAEENLGVAFAARGPVSNISLASRRRGVSVQKKTVKLASCFLLWPYFLLIAAFSDQAQSQQPPRWFPINGKSYFLFGANYPWYNGFRGMDLGPYLGTKTIATIAWKDGQDLQSPPSPIFPGTCGFDADGIRAQLQDAQDVGIHVLRWFFGYDGRSIITFDGQFNCTGIDATALQNIDSLLALAESSQVYIIPVLLDNRIISGDPFLKYQDGSSGVGHPELISDPHKRGLLIENFVKPFVQRYASSSVILCWEIMNEAGNVVMGTDPVTGFTINPPKNSTKPRVSVVDMQTFMNKVYDAIKSVDQTHLVMPSGLARPPELPLVVGRVKADAFGTHYDDNGTTDYGKVQTVAAIQRGTLNKFGLVLDKPLIMTEGSSQVVPFQTGPPNLSFYQESSHLAYYANKAFKGGWAGYLAWTYYDLVGLSDFQRYPRVVTSKDGNPKAAQGINFYQKFNLDHASAVNIGQ